MVQAILNDNTGARWRVIQTDSYFDVNDKKYYLENFCCMNTTTINLMAIVKHKGKILCMLLLFSVSHR